ncbi:MAG: Response regulator receiver domain [Candidatus Parcubacteria bacterium]|jgi:CheY-like chemotaxis protein|nr:Response regulator receiver domain [Candidatus Parcubacteria bacterium]
MGTHKAKVASKLSTAAQTERIETTVEEKAILIVDDQEELAIMLAELTIGIFYERKRKLKDSFNVFSATLCESVREAKRLLMQSAAGGRRIHLVLTDLHVAQDAEKSRDGLEVVKLAKAKAIPVVVVSGTLSFATDDPPFEADAFVRKPFSRAELHAVIDRLFGSDGALLETSAPETPALAIPPPPAAAASEVPAPRTFS